MDLQKTKILLEKINSLFKSIHAERGKMASIERDLMLNYLRQLYELFHQADSESVVNHPDTSTPGESDRTPTSRPRPEPLKRTYQPPRIIEIPDVEREPSSTPSAKTSNSPKREEETSFKVETSSRPSPPTSHAGADTPAIESLFEQKQATELSEKLGESPVNDLGRALAINDRLLFMNELFGKSMSTLDETLQQLNRYQNMEEAKPLLKELAKRYHWTEEERIEIAKSFIKLVRRRYFR